MSRPGFESSFSGIGNLRQEIQSDLRGKADIHEIHSLRSKMGSLEYSIEQINSTLGGLQSELQTIQESIRIIQEQLVDDLSKGEGK